MIRYIGGPPGLTLPTVHDGRGLLIARIHCPACTKQHIDEGKWAITPHHKHLCLFCGQVFRIDEEYVYGVSDDDWFVATEADWKRERDYIATMKKSDSLALSHGGGRVEVFKTTEPLQAYDVQSSFPLPESAPVKQMQLFGPIKARILVHHERWMSYHFHMPGYTDELMISGVGHGEAKQRATALIANMMGRDDYTIEWDDSDLDKYKAGEKTLLGASPRDLGKSC